MQIKINKKNFETSYYSLKTQLRKLVYFHSEIKLQMRFVKFNKTTLHFIPDYFNKKR